MICALNCIRDQERSIKNDIYRGLAYFARIRQGGPYLYAVSLKFIACKLYFCNKVIRN